MRDGFKIFDADAHVIYPADLWPRFLDKRFRDRVGRKSPPGFDHYNPVTVDGRWTQHPTSIHGNFQKAINWTTEDMIAKYGEDLVLEGFTGDRVADAHVIYPADLWPRFLDKRFRDRVGRKSPPGFDHYNPVTVDGRWTQHPTSIYGNFQKAINWTTEDMIAKYGEDLVLEGFTGDRVADALELEGVDVMVVYGPEYDMWLEGIDPELQAAMARAYNRWGAEMREQSSGKVLASGPVPLNDVSRAVDEIRYAYDELGVRCFWTRPDRFNHRDLGDRYYDPIYELLQDLDCAFATHEYMGLNAPTAGSDRFTTFTEWHTVVHPHEAQCALLSMIVHGVFERFPRLRCAYMEAGCGWLPSWLHRIDEHLELAGAAEAPELTMSATEYFSRNCWISTECDDRFVADVIRWMGDGHIVFETDFPHPDSKYPHATEHFLALDPQVVSDDSKRKILWDNAVDLYRFPC